VHEFFPVKKAACGMGHISKLDRFRGEKLKKVTWSQYAGISSSKQELSGIKKNGYRHDQKQSSSRQDEQLRA